MNIPEDVMGWFRDVFAGANRRLSERIMNVPNIPEAHLDTTLIEYLSGYAAPRRFSSDWVIRVDTHFIGGLRHFDSRWEIADIGVLIFFQQSGQLVRRKVALLQSKRLYPTNNEVDILERYDFMIGMSRLGERDNNPRSMLNRRQFVFDESCKYAALISADNQHQAIANYLKTYDISIYYLLYNPPFIPMGVEMPLVANAVQQDDPTLGTRVIPVVPIFDVLDANGPGYRPTLAVTRDLMKNNCICSDNYGWRLEYFMSDLLLGCREGKRFTDDDRSAINALFYRRSGPIAATIAITIEVPDAIQLGD